MLKCVAGTVGVVGTRASITPSGRMAGRACSQYVAAPNSQTTFVPTARPDATYPLVCAVKPAADRGLSDAVHDKGIPKIVGSGLCEKLEQVAL